MEVCDSPLGYIEEGTLDADSRASTEDTLISSRSTINSKCDTNCYAHICKKKHKFRSFSYLIGSTLFTIFGLSSIIWTPFEILMNERIRMRPSFPPFQWWNYPPDEVLLKVFVFNVTNSKEFLSGEEDKLRMQEIGPIIFQEKLTHTDVVFNENGTLSYNATRRAIFLPERNEGINLNDEIYVANMAMLGMSSYMSSMSYFVKFGFKLMMNKVKSDPIRKVSINDFLWNFTDPLLEAAHTISPAMVPTTNMGVLSRIYSDFNDRVTVYIGPTFDHQKFFLIDQFRGTDRLPDRPKSCKDKITNGTEGVLYPQYITKNMTLNYYRKTMCKVTPLHYQREEEKYGINGYRYVLPSTSYDRTYPPEDDCYSGPKATLPNGLSDVSECQYGMPMTAGFPHFLYDDDGNLGDFVIGLNASEEEHGSYVIVEPLTGIPMEGKARSQSSLVMGDLSFFGPKLKRFSKAVIPLFWAEYHQVGLPYYVLALLYFQVKITPILQWFFTALWFLLATLFLHKFIKLKRKQEKQHLIQNAQLQFEAESFLRRQPKK